MSIRRGRRCHSAGPARGGHLRLHRRRSGASTSPSRSSTPRPSRGPSWPPPGGASGSPSSLIRTTCGASSSATRSRHSPSRPCPRPPPARRWAALGANDHSWREHSAAGEAVRDATSARALEFEDSREAWNAMTSKERWHRNDGQLRSRTREGDAFRYIGIDPERSPTARSRFDLTRAELLRLQDRGITYETVSPEEVFSVLGRY